MRILRRLVCAGVAPMLSFCAVVGASSHEQGASPAPATRRTLAYIAAGGGPSQCAIESPLQVAIGFERLLVEGLGFSGEVGALVDRSEITACNAGVASANLFVRFLEPVRNALVVLRNRRRVRARHRKNRGREASSPRLSDPLLGLGTEAVSGLASPASQQDRWGSASKAGGTGFRTVTLS